jgi:peptidoglycan/xylan/chitin deacetylase (PgdA/CDA1 family)
VENLDKILNIFKKRQIGATLFVSGDVLEKYYGLVQKWAEDFEIACHNYIHKSLDQLDLLEREKQIKRFVSVYKTILGVSPKGFRAPGNVIDNEQFRILERYGFLYDSSVIPSHIFLHKYRGFKGRAPKEPYCPSAKNYRKKGNLKILELPNTPLFGGIPFVATWIRRIGVKFFKILLKIKKPKFLCLTMHSWDGIKFKGRSSRNSGEIFLRQLDEILGILKQSGYYFRTGEQIYEEFSQNRK